MASVSHRGTFSPGDPGIGPEGPQGPQGNPGPAGDGSVWIEQYGAVGDGTTDDSAAFSAAIAANPGRVIKLRGATRYVIASTVNITTRMTHLQGEAGGRENIGGTEIVYTGTGPCFELAADNGSPWDALEYDGVQDHWFEHIWLSHGAPDTALDNGLGSYKAGSYAIRDWRGGQVRLRNCGFEKFEYSFWGVQSDVNRFDDVVSLYSKYGIYAGPRCDQFTINNLYSFYCDQSLVVDRARQVRLTNSEIVDCGTATLCPLEVRKGSAAIEFQNLWLEQLNGVANCPGFISAGMVDGYGPGGVGTTTTPAQGISVSHPLVFTNVGAPAHARAIIELGAATGVRLHAPYTPVGSSLTDLNALVEAPAGTAYTNGQSQVSITGVTAALPLADTYLNSGSGAPDVCVLGDGPDGHQFASSQGRLFVKRVGGAVGASSLYLSTENLTGRAFIVAPDYTGGQTTRLRLDRSVQHGSAAPVAGTWQQGDRVINTAPTVGQPKSWVCTVGGTPGTWVSEGNL